MQEFDIKVLQCSIYFTYVCVLDPMYVQEISASRLVELYLGVVFSEIIILFHTHIILPQNFTNNFIFHTTCSSHAIF